MGRQGSNKPDVERYLKGRNREAERRAHLQEKREKKKQTALGEETPPVDNTMTGTILTRAKSGVLVQADREDKHHWCRSRQKGRGGMAVPGDRVLFLPQTETSDGWIEEILERKNLLRRWSFGRIKEIASNMEQVLILATPEEPVVHPRLVDRMLVGASAGGMDALIVVNKVDLIGMGTALEWSKPWRMAGYDVLHISAETGEGLEKLHGRLRNSMSLLVGASGVGKSTVLNRLIEDLDLDTSTISEATGRGVHTTTFTRLFPVPGGGVVADSPGVREFHPVLDDPKELEKHFHEIGSRAGECAYTHCLHMEDSDGCAVRAAVENGEIHPLRYESYQILYTSLLEGPLRGRGRQ